MTQIYQDMNLLSLDMPESRAVLDLQRPSYSVGYLSFKSSGGSAFDKAQQEAFLLEEQQLIAQNDYEIETESIKNAESLVLKALDSSTQLQHYDVMEILGYGSFGVVVKAKYQSRLVAIKICEEHHISASRFCIDPQDGKVCLAEIAILKYISKHNGILEYVASWHENGCWYLVTGLGGFDWRSARVLRSADSKNLVIIKTGVSQATGLDPTRPNDRSFAGLLRSCGGLNMKRVVTLKGPVVPINVIRTVFEQLSFVVGLLHEKGICHRDLKDENVLVDENFRVQLIDFGHASFFEVDNLYPRPEEMFSSYGTSLFCAPEVRSGKLYRGPEGDIYALGLMLYEFHNGDLPENLLSARYVPNGKCIFPFEASNGFTDPLAIDLCRAMLNPDPQNRLTIKSVCEHAWMNTVRRPHRTLDTEDQ